MLRKAARGFTLIELMIVVAIIGILASIAIPNFLRYQLRSKSGEAAVNLGAIKTNEIAYYGSWDTYAATGLYPAVNTTGQRKAWVQTGADSANWNRLGWKPEGDVYFSYAVEIDGTTKFSATAIADLDVSNTNQCWGYFKVPAGTDAVAAVSSAGCTAPAAADTKSKNTVLKASADGEY